MSFEAKFWDKTAKKYAASPIKNMEAYEQTMERTKAHLRPEDRVLEVGCGTGSTALLLAGNVAHITASDISANMIEIGQGKARDQQVENISFVQAPLPDTTVEAESFDAVLAFNILHLVRDLPAVLTQLNTALKPGGVFISKTVCIAEQTRLWAIPIFLARAVRLAPYVSLLTADAMDRAVTEAGFEIMEQDFLPLPMSRFIVARKV